MTNVKFTVLFIATIFYHASFAADNPLDQFTACAKIASDSKRLICFDSAAKSLSSRTDTPAASEVVTSPQISETPTALPDDLGGGEFSSGKKAEEVGYRGHVTSCKKSADRRWFYIFENGQVWKQVDRRKRRHKKCDFHVTLIEDTFGYTMTIDGQDSKIRVDRRR
jgi:hypothetical protein